MSYLALARKWRPRYFSDVVGQDHVVRALLNALETERLHHAYLFSGTRGVGKTTLGRIFAKALNCEQGGKGEPCGECAACKGIDEGRYVDLIEIDGASNRRIDEARDLLQNVQYTPAGGRYKVYLIDEVHMFTKEAFNALLKTLEEPPPHVKFLLATTDPQKLPVTVLSRCLQFNLKHLPTTLIAERMSYICEQEEIKAEAPAVTRLARAASGSLRDGLSLLDQALVFGGGELQEDSVAEMIGSLDPRHLRELMDCLIRGDGAALIGQVRALQEQSPDFSAVLDDLATLLQQIAVLQVAGPGALDENSDPELVAELAPRLDAELLQLLYQIAVTGRRDLQLAPDPRTGFEMTLLRMLAFRPGGSAGGDIDDDAGGQSTREVRSHAKPTAGRAPGGAEAAPESGRAAPVATPVARPGDWSGIVAELSLSGAARELTRHLVIARQTADSLVLAYDASALNLMSDGQLDNLRRALREAFGEQLQVSFEQAADAVDSAASRDRQARAESMENARDAISRDPVIQEIIEAFDARVLDGSVKPVNPRTRH